MKLIKASNLWWFLLIIIVGVALLTISDLGKIASGYRRLITDSKTIRDYLASHSVRKLQLGAGVHAAPGWLNTDIAPSRDQVYLDASQRYPFPDGSFQYVFAEHISRPFPGRAAWPC